ncbi:MAG: TolC family protein [Chitinophagaceae bacterium]
MYSIKRFCAFIPFTFYASHCFSQTPVSLRELLVQVERHAPALLTDSAAVRIRQTQAEATAYNWLPSLKLSYQTDIGTNNNLPGGYFSYGIVPGNSRVQTDANTSTLLTDLGIAAFSWEICNFGAYAAQRNVASSDMEIEQARLTLSRYKLQAATIDNYLRLCQLQELLTVQLNNITRNEEIKRSIEALATAGVRAGVDTSIAEAELSKATLNYIDLRNMLRRTQLQLSALSGLDTGRLIADTAVIRQFPELFPPIDNWSADAANNPFVLPFELSYKNSLNRESLVRRSYNPKITLDAAAWSRGSSLTPTGDFRSLPTGFGFERNNYLVGVGFVYNIFDLKRKQLQLRVQKATTDYVARQLQEQRSALSLQLNSINADLATCMQRLELIPVQLEAANAAYRQKLALYRNGLTDILELNAAINLLYRAETDAILARYKYSETLLQRVVTEGRLQELVNLL